MEVINAAAACISQEGYASASTVRIAEQAEVSWGVLQYHFGDKESLMAAILEYGMEQTEARFDELIAVGIEGETCVDRLRSLIQGAWSIYSSPLARAAMEIVINNRKQWRNDPHREHYLLKLNKRQNQSARKAIQCAVGDEKLAKHLTSTFLAMLHGLEARLLLYGPSYSFSSELETLVQILALYCEHHDGNHH
jgi:AcrR family transcriptional regulator